MKKLSRIINESVWADIYDRSTGDTVRKEDDVNFLSGKGLCDYIKNIYDDSESKYPIRYYNNTLYVPLYSCRRQTNRGNFTNEENIFYDFDGEVIYVLNYISAKVSKLLKKNYNLEPYSTGFYKILPKDGSEINNRFFIGIIDYVLDNIDDLPFKKLLVKKEVNESVWADIYDRSTGDTVRKEDSFNPEYIDFGPDTTVYWAQDALELNGETEFNFEDVENYNNNGWRLPTVKEVEQVDFAKRDKRINWYREDDGIGYTHLNFNEGTFKIKDEDTYATSHLTLWTKDRHEKWKHDAYVYGFNNYKFDIYSSSVSINRKHYVFLVKNKK